MSTKRQTKTCPKCKGSGTTWRKERSHGVWSRIEFPTQCSKCAGIGEVLKEK